MIIESEFSYYDAEAKQQRKKVVERDPTYGYRCETIYWWCTCGGGMWKEVENSRKAL